MIPGFSDNPVGQAWPFWVLGLDPQCGIQDIERAAREIQARLKMQVKDAGVFAIPGGSAQRDEYLVREARARLLDPAARLLCEFWYVSPQALTATSESGAPRRYGVEEWWRMLGRV